MGVIETALTAAQILLIASSSQLKDAVIDSSRKPIIVDVFSEGCGYSRQMATPFTDLKSTYGDSVTFLGANAGTYREIASDYKVAGLPTFVGFACGHEVDRVVGASQDGLEKLVIQLKDTKC
jgi:thioredoxin 1